jgi:hypothetical protein
LIACAAAEDLALETLPSDRAGEFYEEATGGRRKEESNELGPRRTLVNLTERWTSREKTADLIHEGRKKLIGHKDC